MSGTVEMAGRNISGTVTIFEEGEKSYTAMDFPGIGKVEEGYDGETAWENSALKGREFWKATRRLQPSGPPRSR